MTSRDTKSDRLADCLQDLTPPSKHEAHAAEVRGAFIALIVASMACFFVSLAVPAVLNASPDPGQKVAKITGYECLLMGFMYWPSNLLLIVAPAMAFSVYHGGPTTRRIFTLIYGLSALFVANAGNYLQGLSFDHVPRQTPVLGFYLWIAAHCGVSLAYLLVSLTD